MRNPKVSIIIPAYNAEGHLPAALESALGQTWDNLEIICVDDGSTDGTGALMDSCALHHPEKVRVIHTENRGVYFAREAGMDAATGEFVGFCDADDQMQPSMVETLARSIIDNHSDIAVAAYSRISPDGKAVTEMAVPYGRLAVTHDAGWAAAINTALWNKLIRKSVLNRRVRLDFPPRIAEDALVLVTIYPHAQSISFVNKPLYLYRASADGAMAHLLLAEVPSIIDGWIAARAAAEDALPGFGDVVDLAAMVQLGIAVPLGLSKTPGEDVKEGIWLAQASLDLEFSSYRHSRFLKRGYLAQFPFLRKLAAARICVANGLVAPALHAYRALSTHTNLNVNW